VTLDLGAGSMEVLSNTAIIYGQWHELLIDRRGYYVTVIVRSEEGQVNFKSRLNDPQTMNLVDMEIHRVVSQKSDRHVNSDF
jgi:hypothetical protein